LLTRRVAHGGDALGTVLVQLRFADIPIGQVEVDHGPAFWTSLARSITPAHAERALRIATASWVTLTSRRSSFSVEGAFRLTHDGNSRAAGAGADGEPSVTIAICSRHRTAELARALTAIVPLLGKRDELLVVLNAAVGDAAHAAIDPGCFPRARFVVEPRLGLGWARNRALVECATDLIAFTDDDCLPESHWLESLRMLFARNPEVDLATGLIEPMTLETPAQWLFERYGGFARNYSRRWIRAPNARTIAGAVGNVGEYGAGANLAFRRRLIDQIGAFDVALGPGTASNAGDDLEFIFRALKHGRLLAIDPRASVRHEHRRDHRGLESQIEGWSRGFSCAIASATRTFPEEHIAYQFLRARIAVLHHARRALLSPHARRLACLELIGMRAAGARYSRAQREAARMAETTPSTALDASSIARCARGAAHGPPKTTSCVTVDFDDIRQTVRTGRDVDCLSVVIPQIAGLSGVVDVPVVNGSVGPDRALDTVLDVAGAEVIGADWQAAVVRARRLLHDTAVSLA
jgi:glycosyltransferase involved in cell wall biosynthesis